MNRLTLVIFSLAGGGAERVLVRLANEWARLGREVTVITIDSSANDAYVLDEKVERVELGLLHSLDRASWALRANAKRVRALRAAIRESEPDAVISFIDKMNVAAIIATAGLRVPLVISERTDPRFHPVDRLTKLLRRVLYRFASALVVQTDEVAGWAADIVDPRRVHVVPNPIDASHAPGARVDGSERWIVGMGRLIPEKGFDVLLRAFADVSARHPSWRVLILGDGAERATLDRLRQELRIADRVELAGRVAEPAPVLRTAHLFAMTSEYEGFPNALLEAMACGLPAVSFDCPSGPRAIIRHGVDGLLVPPGDASALARALDELMSDDARRSRYAERARDVAARFSMASVTARWDQVLAAARAGA